MIRVDKSFLQTLFNSEKNRDKREWFFNSYSLENQDLIRNIYYDFLKESGQNVDFFVFLKHWSKAKGYSFPFGGETSKDTIDTIISTSCNMIENSYKPYRLANDKDDNDLISSIHPPSVPVYVGTEKIRAVPYKKVFDKEVERKSEEVQGINQVLEQNNYTNLFLQSLGTQLTRIKKVVTSKVKPLSISPSPAETPAEILVTSSKEGKLASRDKPGVVLFKPPPELTKEFKLGSASTEMFEELKNRLEKLILKRASNESTSQGPSVSVLKKDGLDLDEILNKIQEEHDDPQINRLKWGKVKNQPYYHRPSPIDAQFENRAFNDGIQFNGEYICEWNLDGLTDYQIIVLLKQMTMFAQAARIKANSEKRITQALASGFVGQLGLWWDNLLSSEVKESIFNF